MTGILNYSWFKYFVWFSLAISAFEAFIFATGGPVDQIFASIGSIATILLGLLAAAFVFGTQFAFGRATYSITGPKYLNWMQAFAIFTFWCGLVLAAIILIMYPLFIWKQEPILMAPVGIGISLGSRWALRKHLESDRRHVTSG